MLDEDIGPNFIGYKLTSSSQDYWSYTDEDYTLGHNDSLTELHAPIGDEE